MKKIGDITNTADKNGEFTDGNVAAGTPPTQLMGAWFNSVQREILNVLAKAGVPQSATKEDQLAEAITKIVASAGYLPTGYSYSKTESDGRYQPKGNYAPAGDYATNTALNNGLNQKFDKTGGTINGNVAVTSDIQGAQVRAKTADDSQINLNPASTEGPRIEHKTKGGTWYAHLLPNATGTLMQVGDLGFGAGRKSNATDTITIKNFNDADRTAVYKSDDLTENARFTYSPMLNMTRRGGADGTGFCSQIQVDSHTGILSSRGGASGGRFSGWMDAYSPANTIKDRNGNLKVSGSSNELSDYPVGAPIPWPQATAPAGFLVCNGQSFNKTTYPLLAKAYPTGILPDLRGEFLRGLDTGRGVDSGRAVLSAQGDAFRAHNHSVIGEDSGSGTAYFGRGNGSRRTISKDAMNLEGGTETRPRNVAFLYIVRAA